ncbi:MAG: CapA family protein [Eubacteriales bacterium]|nr:CapA family protein [Eubacteriales bacterium]
MSQNPQKPRKRVSAAQREKIRRRRRRRLALTIVCLLIVLVVIVWAIRALTHQFSNSGTDAGNGSAQQVSSVITQTEKKKKTVYEPASVSLIAVGDNLIHNTLLKDASNGDGTYDFIPFYEEIKPYVEAADIAFINQESPLGTGEPSGYPSFNTPQACGEALIDTGFDVICHANNHAMDSGSDAVYDTLDFWDSHADDDVIRIGIARDAKDRAEIRYVERNGMKIGFLAYTYGLNGYSLPDNNPDLVSLIDKDTIAKEMAAVKKKCDAVVVVMHWGEEYQDVENEEQEELAEFLTENGATLIIGGHPHVCQPCDWVESENGNRAFCIYSTGNFISAQDKSATMVEAMLQVTLTRKTDGTVVVENPGVMPLVCYFNSGWRGYRVIPMDDYTESLSNSHALSGRVDMSVSHLHSIAENAFGNYLIEKTIPTTYDTAYAKAHGEVAVDSDSADENEEST